MDVAKRIHLLVAHGIQEMYDEKECTISELCKFSGIPRSSYYKWLNRKESENEQFNKTLLPLIKGAYEDKGGIPGYRQMTIKLNRENGFNLNNKRIYRLMRILNLKSVCRKKKKSYIKSTPQNGPMETFWGMLKSEMYYLKKFNSYDELKNAVIYYIEYYNNGHYQKRLNCMTPLEFREYLQHKVA